MCLWGWWFALREGPVGRILSPAQYGGEMAPSSAALGLWGPRPAGGWHCFVFLPIGSWHFGEHLLEYVPELGGVNSVFSFSTLMSYHAQTFFFKNLFLVRDFSLVYTNIS